MTTNDLSTPNEQKLETDVFYRFQYVSSVLGLSEKDSDVMVECREILRPKLGEIVDEVYEKMFEFNSMKRHFVQRHEGFEGRPPKNLEEVSTDHEQTQFRKKRLEEFFLKLSTAKFDETFAVLLDLIGFMHTPGKGNPMLEVPVVQLTALLGFIADRFLVCISQIDIPKTKQTTLLCAYSKIFWIQNNMFIRHYVK